jgi:hypothetical protein
VDNHWASTQSMYGITPQTPSYGVSAPTAHMGTDDLAPGWRSLVDLHNPLVWLGIIGGVTLGLGAFSSRVRAGGATVSASVGKT